MSLLLASFNNEFIWTCGSLVGFIEQWVFANLFLCCSYFIWHHFIGVIFRDLLCYIFVDVLLIFFVASLLLFFLIIFVLMSLWLFLFHLFLSCCGGIVVHVDIFVSTDLFCAVCFEKVGLRLEVHLALRSSQQFIWRTGESATMLFTTHIDAPKVCRTTC